jgi:hypothetical protein
MVAKNYIVAGFVYSLLLSRLPLCAQESASVLTAGTRLRVEFNTAVGTAISRPNDGVEVRLLKPAAAGGREILPVGTVLTGRVLAVRKGDKRSKTYAMIRLAFTRATPPDGRSFPMQASLADLGVSEYVDSEGAASTKPPTKGGDVAVPVMTGAAGAGIGAIAGGGKGAAIGAGVGGAVGVLSDLAAHSLQWDDFTLKRGRKAWLRLDDDLSLTPPPSHVREEPDIQGPSASAQLPQAPATPPSGENPPRPGAAPAPPPPKPENKGVDADLTVPVATATASSKPENKGVVYVEPAPKARFYHVNTEALLRDLNKAGVPLTINPTQADYLLRTSQDSHGFHAELTDHDGRIAWVGSTRTQRGLAQGIVRYMREHALLK